MFKSCKLSLMQNQYPNNPNTLRRLNIKLLEAQAVPVQGTAMYEWMVAMQDYQWWGEWRLGTNSQTGRVDTGYTIGSSAPQEEKFWRYSGQTRELRFMERWKMTGTDENGDEIYELKVALILHEARITAKGIEPFDPSGTGRGTVELRSSNILMPGYYVDWEFYPSWKF